MALTLAQSIHQKLDALPGLYAQFLEQPPALVQEYAEFAEDTYNSVRMELEMEAERLDCLLRADPQEQTQQTDGYSTKYAFMEILASLASRYPLTTDSLNVACLSNNVNLVRFLLLERKGHLNPAEFRDEVDLQSVCERGYIEILRLFLEDKRFNLSKYQLELHNNFKYSLLAVACMKGQIEIVQLLLTVDDPTADDCEVLFLASNAGYSDIVELLMADPRITSKDSDYLSDNLLYIAASGGFTDIVKALLKLPQVDPSFENNQAIYWACTKNLPTIVRMLIADPRVNPADRNNMAFLNAINFGRREILEILSEDPRVQAAATQAQQEAAVSRMLNRL